MKFRALDLNLLVVLDLLLVERSVSRTAEKLGLTQSAVSVQLAKLRDHFKDDLLVQVGRRMALTALAELLRPQVARLLVRTKAVIDTRSTFDPATARRHFRFATTDLEIALLFSRVNRRLAVEAPEMSIQVKEVHSVPRLDGGTVENFLNLGKVDFIVVPKGSASPRHPSEPLYAPYGYVCLVWEGNTQIGSVMSRAQYLAAKHVVRMFGEEDCQTFDTTLLQAQGIKRKIATVVEAYMHIPMMLEGTPYVATMSERWAAALAHKHNLRIVPCPIDLPKTVCVLQWQNHLKVDPAAQWLRGVINEEAEEMARGTPWARVPVRPVESRTEELVH